MIQYVVMRNSSPESTEQAWLLVVAGRMLAAFHSHEAACRAAVTLARIDLLSGREADVWLDGCGENNQRIRLRFDPIESGADETLTLRVEHSGASEAS